MRILVRLVFLFILLCWLNVTHVFGAVQLPFQPQVLPYKIAENAEFELIVPQSIKLTNFIFITSSGKLETSVSNENNQAFEHHRFIFPINNYSWTEFSFRFTPLNDGEVVLKLAGPYELSPQGKPFRADNLWDDIKIAGSEIKNPGFEDVVGNRPKDWIVEGGVANSGPMPAKEGRNYARTSFDRVLKTRFAVKANTPVTLKLHGRSLPPPAYNDMRRIISRTTPAHTGVKGYSRGVNLVNWLDLPPENKAQCPYIYTDFQLIKAEGFDHVRIPIAWHLNVAAPEYKISPEFFLKVEYIITNSFINKLNVILAWTGFEELSKNPLANSNLFLSVWRQVSDFYTLYPTNLAFELLDCPSENMLADVMNSIYSQALAVIRSQNPERLVFLGPQGYSVDNIGKLRLPFEDDTIVVCVRITDPIPFTYQGLQRNGLDLKNLKGIVFPGPPQTKLTAAIQNKTIADWIEKYNSLPAELNPSSNRMNLMKLDAARQWSEFYGRPVYLCGFGASSYADDKSRATFYSQIRRTAEGFGISWSINDWKLDFRYLDPARNQPVEGLREALFKK